MKARGPGDEVPGDLNGLPFGHRKAQAAGKNRPKSFIEKGIWALGVICELQDEEITIGGSDERALAAAWQFSEEDICENLSRCDIYATGNKAGVVARQSEPSTTANQSNEIFTVTDKETTHHAYRLRTLRQWYWQIFVGISVVLERLMSLLTLLTTSD